MALHGDVLDFPSARDADVQNPMSLMFRFRQLGSSKTVICVETPDPCATAPVTVRVVIRDGRTALMVDR